MLVKGGPDVKKSSTTLKHIDVNTKMADIWQPLSSAFFWMKIVVFSFTFHRRLFLREKLIISQHYSDYNLTLNKPLSELMMALQWHHNGCDGISNHQPHDCLFNHLFRHRSKKMLKLRVTGLCAGNSLVTVEFPTQMTSNAENVSIWWRHHGLVHCGTTWPRGR